MPIRLHARRALGVGTVKEEKGVKHPDYMTDHIEVDYTDERGIKRRVLIPDHTVPPEEGIPISLSLDAHFEGMPDRLLARLVDELWALDLITPADFLKPAALRNIQAAIAAFIRTDAFTLQSLAQEQKHNAIK